MIPVVNILRNLKLTADQKINYHKSMNFFMTHSKNIKKHNVPVDFVT